MMASDIQVEDDLDPQDFLRRVRAMTEERDREDRQRVTDIEKDIMQSREQRRARRADHARSLSNAPIGAEIVLSPTAATRTDKTPNKTERQTSSPTRPAESPTVTRSNTMSWQQRRRPLSQIALENNHLQNHQEPVPQSPEKEIARADIAQTLASKDPSWFKQTADRGIGSAALRRTPEPETTDFGDFKLPGLAYEPPSMHTTARSASRPHTPTRTASQRESTSRANRPLPTPPTATSKEAIAVDNSSIVDLPRPESRSGTTSGRASPTKGMGGFVQSAMMKRSDSVTKRWNAAPTHGLQRAGSTAGDRAKSLARSDSVKGMSSANSQLKLNINNRPSGLAGISPLETTSRPTSPYTVNNFNSTSDISKNNATGRNELTTAAQGSDAHSRSKSVVSLRSSTPNFDDSPIAASPPLSPSKRWSPTKSSWLESKLSQPEEKPKAVPPPSQPSWMTDLAKANQQRNSTVIEGPLDALEIVQEDKPAPVMASSVAKPAPTMASTTVEQEKEPKDVATPLRSRQLSNARSPQVAPKPAMNQSPESGKVDFRANLKSRAPPPGPKPNDKAEFQSRFGNLRKTETKNYVAPDELKNNILRGKAGLTQTGGPAKRERVDELKESLLKRKEEMKMKAANEPKQPTNTPKVDSTPEALLRRQRMNKVDAPRPLARDSAASSVSSLANNVTNNQRDRSGEGLARTSSTASNVTKSAPRANISSQAATEQAASESSKTNPRLANKINPALAGILARGPPGLASTIKAGPSVTTKQSEEATQDSRELTHMTKGRARGPKRRAPKNKEEPVQPPSDVSSPLEPPPVHMFRLSDLSLASTSPGPDKPSFATSTAAGSLNVGLKTAPAADSTIGTKAKIGLPANPRANLKPASVTTDSAAPTNLFRAQKAPATNTNASSPGTNAQANSVPKIEQPIAAASQDEVAKTSPAADLGSFNFGLDAFEIDDGSALPSPEPTKLQHDRAQTPVKQTIGTIAQLDKRVPAEQPSKPINIPRSPDRISVREAIAKEAQSSYAAPFDFTKPPSQPPSPSRSPVAVSVRDAASRWNVNGNSPAAATRSRPKSPIKLPKQEDEDKAMVAAGLKTASNTFRLDKSKKQPTGLGLISIDTSDSTTLQANKAPKLTISPASAADAAEQSQTQTSPIKRSRPPSMTIKVPPPDSPLSPIPHTSEAAKMFTEFFDDQPRISGSTEIDVLTVIQNYPLNNEKIETIKAQVQELSEDGNLTPMPNGRQHILFEDSMYVCVHIFKNARGVRNTEVYFWSGHNVQSADAQMFARNIAKFNTGRFVPIKQGKEPPAFFQALGGILITFRGSRTKKRESTGLPEKFVLCGRKHLGHIAFDEVDFARSSFCSGFPYLVSDKKDLYLWRGAGSSADELGCARLIAIDIGLRPEVTEIVEGQEPASFLSMFPVNMSAKVRSPGIPPSATHWRLKASIGDKYRARLFRITQEPVSMRKNSTFQVSNFFGGLANTAAHLLPSAKSPSTPSFASPASTIQSPFTEGSIFDKKSLSLLASNQNTPQTPYMPSEVGCNVDEIVPFCREDLQGEGVWVLDAFFEVYIILSPLSNTQNHAFSAALLFAQDYVILAASVEDRPFVPVSTVVVGGAPKDMRAVFRRWNDTPTNGSSPLARALPTNKLMAGKPLRRGGSMRTVGLSAALAAVQR